MSELIRSMIGLAAITFAGGQFERVVLTLGMASNLWTGRIDVYDDQIPAKVVREIVCSGAFDPQGAMVELASKLMHDVTSTKMLSVTDK